MKRRGARETKHLHIIAESNGAATSKVLARRKGESEPIATGVLNLARPKDRAQFVAQLPPEHHAEAEHALLGLCGDALSDGNEARRR